MGLPVAPRESAAEKVYQGAGRIITFSMNDLTPPRRISRPRIVLMIAIDVAAVLMAIALYMWFEPRDPDAAVLGAVSPLVFGAFFNLVIALVSLKP
jgi:hypothetical protein